MPPVSLNWKFQFIWKWGAVEGSYEVVAQIAPFLGLQKGK
jgi:hypothetical protein